MFTKCHATGWNDVSLQNKTRLEAKRETNQTNLKCATAARNAKIYVVFDFYYVACAIFYRENIKYG